MAQVSAACSITLLTHVEYTRPLVARGTLRFMRRGSSWQNLPHALWDSLEFFVINLHLFHCSSINRLCLTQASGAPEIRVRAQGTLDATAFLVYPSQAATTEDCIATYSFLTDTAGVLSRFLQQVQIHARHHYLCLPHVYSQTLLLNICFPCLVPPWTQH